MRAFLWRCSQFPPTFASARYPINLLLYKMDYEQQQHDDGSFFQNITMLHLPCSREISIIQDNAASLPNCMSKTMRRYLLQTFPDLADVAPETRWKSQPPIVTKTQSLRNILPMAPQRQDSFSLSSCSTHSSISSTSSKPSPPMINRRSLLKRQTSSLSLLVRQSSLRRLGSGAGMPRMPQRQDSVTFLC